MSARATAHSCQMAFRFAPLKRIPATTFPSTMLIVEVQAVPDQWSAGLSAGRRFLLAAPLTFPYAGNAAPQYQSTSRRRCLSPEPNPSSSGLAAKIPAWLERASTYLDKDILPGVYKLPELFEFKWVLAQDFMALFILLVTSALDVTADPHLKIRPRGRKPSACAHDCDNSRESESRPALMQGTDSSISVDIALSRPGVKKALIISNLDGNIMAPASQAGTYPDLPFIHDARKLNVESVKQIDDNTIAAVVPIDFYNAETGTQSVTADAVVFYDMSSIAVDSSEELSLFISTLFIALLVGSIIYYFLYKIVEYPFKSINDQLDSALKDGRDTVSINYRFPALQTLANNVSSALTRAMNGSQEAGKVVEHDRNREVTNIVELIGFAAMGVHAHYLSIAAVNQAFESRTGMKAEQTTHMSVNEIMDQALKLSIKDLIERVLDKNPEENSQTTNWNSAGKTIRSSRKRFMVQVRWLTF